MKNLKLFLFLFLPALPFILESCKKNPDDNTINIFSIQDDKNLGLQVKAEIFSNPSEYPILDSNQYPQAYAYLRGIVQKILDGGEVYYKDEFLWETYIIQDDNVLNAFCTPGGYMFVYTGLIKYLEAEHELAGVMGHEIAHADRRHSTDAMTRDYGIAVLLSVALGENPGQLATIAANLSKLKFSRTAESEADKYSVNYLCPTDYKADGASAFFQKLIDNGQGNGGLEWFSTHPSPDNRVQAIQDYWNTKGCSGSGTFDAAYANFKNNMIP
ncbi:MAG: M48 family metalloprotease [Bacteroidota bacterium]|nr:M48 family metalloprotease [Bacteroidota bacterium]MDX5430621.1 M48 family metalloprotease [Bacteroidota bacterium]MDX5469373.1 M48 family metalloprotease [Bacteroidota bacterium]